MAVYSIAPHEDFLARLAEGVLARGSAPEDLARTVIFLPNRRSCRLLGERFLEVVGQATLLPSIQPLGEWEEAEAGFGMPDLPPVMPPFRRRYLLARLVMRFMEKNPHRFGGGAAFDGRAAAGGRLDDAVRLAEALERALDEVQRERGDWRRLRGLVASDSLSKHWQEVCAFLSIIGEQWPEVLKEHGMHDPVQHRNRVLEGLAERWRNAPPEHPVIIAGSTGSVPATRDLMRAALALPQGAVVIPGDYGNAGSSTPGGAEELPPTHPRHGVRALLHFLRYTDDDVMPWHGASPEDTERAGFVRAVFAPEGGRAAPARGIRVAEAADGEEEAALIAIAMRELLEDHRKTVALVTHDRALARRVSAALARHGVACDDSAGTPLPRTAEGSLLALLADGVGSVVALLAVLKHPLTALGVEPVQCRRHARRLEKEWLRGGAAADVWTLCEQAHRRAPEAGEYRQWLSRLLALMTPVAARGAAPAHELLEAQIALAEALAATHEKTGAECLWASDAGAQLREHLQAMREGIGALGAIHPSLYPAIFRASLESGIYRPRYGTHPRAQILSPMEARLQRFDRVILGGMNEGSWPQQPPHDPWMSRAMRAAFGLPPHAASIGRAAHDLENLLHAPDVLLTRARREEGGPATPSRWWMRMQLLWAAEGGVPDVTERYRALRAAMLPSVPPQPVAAPSPAPPVAARPRDLTISDIRTLIHDPYAIYAKYVLNLRPLDELEEEPGGREFGTLVHRALEEYCKAVPEADAEQKVAHLCALGDKLMDRLMAAHLRPYWQPRFEAIARWFVAEDSARRAEGREVAVEQGMEMLVDLPAGATRVRGRADRIEKTAGGRYVLVDYKTGTIPSGSAVLSLQEPQLPLEAAMLGGGADALEYWPLKGRGEENIIRVEGKDMGEKARAMLESLLSAYDRPETPYLAAPDIAADDAAKSPYAHLERQAEWKRG